MNGYELTAIIVMNAAAIIAAVSSLINHGRLKRVRESQKRTETHIANGSNGAQH